MSKGSLTLGGNMSVAVGARLVVRVESDLTGPVGRNAEGTGAINTKVRTLRHRELTAPGESRDDVLVLSYPRLVWRRALLARSTTLTLSGQHRG